MTITFTSNLLAWDLYNYVLRKLVIWKLWSPYEERTMMNLCLSFCSLKNSSTVRSSTFFFREMKWQAAECDLCSFLQTKQHSDEGANFSTSNRCWIVPTNAKMGLMLYSGQQPEFHTDSNSLISVTMNIKHVHRATKSADSWCLKCCCIRLNRFKIM